MLIKYFLVQISWYFVVLNSVDLTVDPVNHKVTRNFVILEIHHIHSTEIGAFHALEFVIRPEQSGLYLKYGFGILRGRSSSILTIKIPQKPLDYY